jgi:hypothetical protein
VAFCEHCVLLKYHTTWWAWSSKYVILNVPLDVFIMCHISNWSYSNSLLNVKSTKYFVTTSFTVLPKTLPQ